MSISTKWAKHISGYPNINLNNSPYFVLKKKKKRSKACFIIFGDKLMKNADFVTKLLLYLNFCSVECR